MTDITWQPVTVRLADLTPWERNPKRISKAHASRLLDLWQRLGQFQTIAIGPAGEVYDGHQRLSVLKAKHGAGYEVQALQSSRALSEREREELTIAAHSGTTGAWDWDALSGWDAGNLQSWGFDAETLTNWQTDIGALRTMVEAESIGVLGVDDVVDKNDRAGSSPWDRVENSNKVRCLVGDVEFGVDRDIALRWASNLFDGTLTMREAAEAWFTKNTP